MIGARPSIPGRPVAGSPRAPLRARCEIIGRRLSRQQPEHLCLLLVVFGAAGRDPIAARRVEPEARHHSGSDLREPHSRGRRQVIARVDQGERLHEQPERRKAGRVVDAEPLDLRRQLAPDRALGRLQRCAAGAAPTTGRAAARSGSRDGSAACPELPSPHAAAGSRRPSWQESFAGRVCSDLVHRSVVRRCQGFGGARLFGRLLRRHVRVAAGRRTRAPVVDHYDLQLADVHERAQGAAHDLVGVDGPQDLDLSDREWAYRRRRGTRAGRASRDREAASVALWQRWTWRYSCPLFNGGDSGVVTRWSGLFSVRTAAHGAGAGTRDAKRPNSPLVAYRARERRLIGKRGPVLSRRPARLLPIPAHTNARAGGAQGAEFCVKPLRWPLAARRRPRRIGARTRRGARSVLREVHRRSAPAVNGQRSTIR